MRFPAAGTVVSAFTPAAQDKETVFWQSVRDSNDPEMYRAYLKAYPDGTFSSLARIKLKKLQSAPPAPGAVRAAVGICDRLAAYGNDYDRVAAAVSFEALEQHAARAVEACFAAIQAAPDVPRLRFQLARAYAADGLEKQALALFMEMAGKGYPAALLMLGNTYSAGFFGVARDRDEAERYYRAAYEAGNPVGALNLADIYYFGRSSHGEDEAAAFKLYKAIEEALGNDFPLIYERLGYLYADGKGVSRDGRRAVAYYELAVEHKIGLAAYNLGEYYLKGRFVDADVDKAGEYFAMAADFGTAAGLRGLAQVQFLKFNASARPYLAAKEKLRNQLKEASGIARLKIRKKLLDLEVKANIDALNYIDETLQYIKRAREKEVDVRTDHFYVPAALSPRLEDPYAYVLTFRRRFESILRDARKAASLAAIRVREQGECLKISSSDGRVYIRNRCGYDLNVLFTRANSAAVNGDTVLIEAGGKVYYGSGLEQVQFSFKQCIPPRRPRETGTGRAICE